VVWERFVVLRAPNLVKGGEQGGGGGEITARTGKERTSGSSTELSFVTTNRRVEGERAKLLRTGWENAGS